jgi:hypothetical protein
MDEEKCCDECCDQQQDQGLRYSADYQPQGDAIESDGLSGTVSFNGSGMTVGGDFQTDNKVKMHDLVIKEMDYGYLVKAGCQTLCVETPDHLVTLFKAYVKDPEKVMKLHNSKKLNELYIEDALDRSLENRKKRREEARPDVNIAVVGNSLDDVKNFLADIVPLAVRGATAVRKYMLETPDYILYYYAVSRIDHTRGMDFDRVVETHRARENRDFPQIIEATRTSLKTQK